MILRDELISIGQFNKPHGINGEISATFDYDLDDIEHIDCIIVEIDGIFVPFFIESRRTKSGASLLLTIDGCNSDSDVKFLVNQTIYCLKSEFTATDDTFDGDEAELPIDYFIGFNALTDDNSLIGEITDIDDSTDNILFCITSPSGKEIQIPAVDEFIIDIDDDTKTLLLSLPDGLLSL